eukprot:jgi/Botrbrau1/1671/Bobra.116_2s0015.1
MGRPGPWEAWESFQAKGLQRAASIGATVLLIAILLLSLSAMIFSQGQNFASYKSITTDGSYSVRTGWASVLITKPQGWQLGDRASGRRQVMPLAALGMASFILLGISTGLGLLLYPAVRMWRGWAPHDLDGSPPRMWTAGGPTAYYGVLVRYVEAHTAAGSSGDLWCLSRPIPSSPGWLPAFLWVVVSSLVLVHPPTRRAVRVRGGEPRMEGPGLDALPKSREAGGAVPITITARPPSPLSSARSPPSPSPSPPGPVPRGTWRRLFDRCRVLPQLWSVPGKRWEAGTTRHGGPAPLKAGEGASQAPEAPGARGGAPPFLRRALQQLALPRGPVPQHLPPPTGASHKCAQQTRCSRGTTIASPAIRSTCGRCASGDACGDRYLHLDTQGSATTEEGLAPHNPPQADRQLTAGFPRLRGQLAGQKAFEVGTSAEEHMTSGSFSLLASAAQLDRMASIAASAEELVLTGSPELMASWAGDQGLSAAFVGLQQGMEGSEADALPVPRGSLHLQPRDAGAYETDGETGALMTGRETRKPPWLLGKPGDPWLLRRLMPLWLMGRSRSPWRTGRPRPPGPIGAQRLLQ